MRRSISCTKILIIICAFEDSNKAQTNVYSFDEKRSTNAILLEKNEEY